MKPNPELEKLANNWTKNALNAATRLNAHEKRIAVFMDTQKQCNENSALKEAIKNSCGKQFVLLENDTLTTTQEKRFSEPVKIIVSKKRTFEAASGYKEGKVCVLNFASSTHAGGGVVNGSGAQEECLCRCSTLYFCISQKNVTDKFHSAHIAALKSDKLDCTYNDDCIYTSDVIVFKSDTLLPETLPQEQWHKTDVITCAAPNLRHCNAGEVPNEILYEIHLQRGKRIFDLAKSQGVDHIVLGAFGCGAFANPPEVVASAYRKLAEKYKFDFKTIEFAIYCADEATENYKAFQKVFE